MRAFALAVVIVSVAAEAANYAAPIDPIWAPALAPREECTEMPPLCTDHVMMHGSATTLTYLCPQTAVPSTIRVTVTTTTTVTAVSSDKTEVPPEKTSNSSEPITTTTILSTSTKYKTVTLTRKKTSTSKTADAKAVTTSTSYDIPLTSQADSLISISLSPILIPSISRESTTSITRSIITATPIISTSSNKRNSTSHYASTTEITATPIISTSSRGLNSTIRYTKTTEITATPISSTSSDELSSTFHFTRTTEITATPITSSAPIYRNSTTSGGYKTPTVHVIREVNPTEPVKKRKTGGAGRVATSLTKLFFGCMLAAPFRN